MRYLYPFCSAVRVMLITAVLLTVSSAWAEYRDPLDKPTLPASIANQSLQLDMAKAGERIVSVGERGLVLWSVDDGDSWQQAQVPSSNQLNAVFFSGAYHGWAVGEDQLVLHTNDGGRKWSHQSDFRTGELSGPLLDVWFKDAATGFAVGVFNSLLHTRDGGKHWQNWQGHIDNEDEWHLFAINASELGNIYIASEAGLIFRSMDAGARFTALQTGHEGSFHGVLARENQRGKDSVLAFGVGGVLMLSVNSGASWQQIQTHTYAGISNGIWLDGERALLSLADGNLLVVNIERQSSKLINTGLGYPLSSLAMLDDDRLALTGLAGVQHLSLSALLTEGMLP